MSGFRFSTCTLLQPMGSSTYPVWTPQRTTQWVNKQSLNLNRFLGSNLLATSKVTALKGIAYLYLNMRQFECAKEYDRTILELEPNDPETYYAIGVIDWTESYQLRMEQRAKLNLKPDEPLIAAGECWNVRSENEERVKEGIEMLTKAISIRQTYDDAMAYMNLMYRERGDIQCGDTRAYRSDIRTADQWVDVTMATKKAKEAPSSPAHKR